MFICYTAYSVVHIMNLSTVKTSSFTQFIKPSEVLTYGVSIEKYENYFCNIYIYIGTYACGCYVVIFQ